jgi:ribose transport system substrate-binding protein
MKKIFTCICALMLCVGLVSCKKADGNAAAAAGTKHKIGILAPAVTHGWVAAVAYFAEQRCKQLSDIDYKILTSQSAEQMTQQLDDLEAWGAEAIVTFPQWQGMEAPFAAAIKRGIKVVSFDIEVKADGIYLVSGDNESMGVASAKYIVEKVGKDATVAVLTVPTSGSVSELRLKGFIDTVKQIAPNLKLIERATKFTREDGLKDFADILAANPQIDAVYSLDDETSIGVLQAIADAGRTDIKAITGGGGCQEYFQLIAENKDIAVSSSLYSPLMIRDCFDVALAKLAGEEVEAVTVIPSQIVDASNVADYLDPSNTIY